MSTAWALALPPLALISPATFSAPTPSRSRMPTVHPSSPRRLAMAAPMPLAPPVSTTTFPFNPRMDTRSLCLASQHARGLIADDYVAVLVLDVDPGGDDAAVALRRRPHRRDLDLGVDGVADPHRRQHLFVEFEHRKPG